MSDTTQPREQATSNIAWSHELQKRLMVADDQGDDDLHNLLGEVACCLAALTGRPDTALAPVAAPEAPTLTQRLNTPDQIDAYARQLAMSLWRTHYRLIAPEFGLLDDTYGVLTQIDNMLTGLVLAPPAATVDAQADTATVSASWQKIVLHGWPK